MRWTEQTIKHRADRFVAGQQELWCPHAYAVFLEAPSLIMTSIIFAILLAFATFRSGRSQAEDCTSTPPCPRQFFSYYCQAGLAVNGCSPTPFNAKACSQQCLYKPKSVVSTQYD